MHLSRGTRWALRIGTGLTLAFLYLPLIVIAIYAFNSRRTATWPPPGFTLTWFDKAFHNHGVRSALWTSVEAGLGDGDRARARDAGVVRGLAPPVLRARDRLVPGHPADRAAGHRHRHGVHHDLHAGAGHRPVAVHDHRRPRDVLHRRRLQQRHRAPAPHQRLVR